MFYGIFLNVKEPLKGTLIDPFNGTPGFISSTVGPVRSPSKFCQGARKR